MAGLGGTLPMICQTLGHYQIIEKIGASGMAGRWLPQTLTDSKEIVSRPGLEPGTR
jgi:hypothetical protein